MAMRWEKNKIKSNTSSLVFSYHQTSLECYFKKLQETKDGGPDSDRADMLSLETSTASFCPVGGAYRAQPGDVLSDCMSVK